MNTPLFAKLPANVSFPALEQGILTLWRELDAFRESNRRRTGGPEFVFYDGPPFATGTPHYGHLLAGTIKDIVPRFWSMRGHHVERRFGWDCHGLPIENLAQKALGWSGAAEIREKGVDVFNEQCRAMVQTYVGEWRRTVERMGRWVDFDNDYKTMDPQFMESVWWVFKQLWEQRDAQGRPRIYKAHRIMPYDPVLSTPLSNFEAGNNYKDVQDPAITIKFRLHEGAAAKLGLDRRAPGALVYALAWTTTPWTLPANLGLCVGPDISYVAVRETTSGEVHLLAADRLAAYAKKPEQYEELLRVVGKDLVGLDYVPLLPYFRDTERGFNILADAFVTTGDGTGIVHLAPAYGEDDYRVCQAAGIKLVDPLDNECRFTAAVAEYAGQFCKDADKAIIKRLKDEGKLLVQSTIVHSYPFGERSEAPLIFRAIEAWYVRVEDLRERLLANNAQIRWVPEAIGANRFGNWLREAKDWNISRNRFWGSCLPIWVNVADKNDMKCFGSIAELETAAGLKPGTVTDLHKHTLDGLIITTPDGRTYQRTPEVLDCWFESGAMPYAQNHYPFENKAAVEANFPANFIAEGLDQTRGWFYTLLVLSTALFDKPAFRNVVVNGLVLAEDGQKMSKSKKNYPDPNLILDQIGADALRAYLIDSPVVRADPLRFSETGLKEIVRTVVLPYWNALSFFTTYASVDGYDPRTWIALAPAQRPEADRWILSVMQSLVRDVNTEMEAYRLYNVVPRLVAFIDDLTNWYIRSSRSRFWNSGGGDAARADQNAAYATLYAVLTTFAKVLAPFMPFLTEEVYQRLVRPVDAAAPASVHWCDYPRPEAALIDEGLEARVAVARRVVGLGLKLRNDQKLKVRQPLATVTVISRDAALRAAVTASAALIADELNVRSVATEADEAAFCSIAVKPNFAALRARAGAKLKEIGAVLAGWGVAEIATLEQGRHVEVAGVQLALADVLLTRTPTAGGAIASDGAMTVALDTALTQALKDEGHAREFISVLQQARKAAGLDVSDRIAVTWSTDHAEVGKALTEYGAYISGEVLAPGFQPGAHAEDWTSADINGAVVRYRLVKDERL
ncbi:MAG: isoleucine--tRNA ligase [Planctomycetes bacterium]|nr:isoleucine--tRNA ligase [Planctomycetota bacterium]